jgi:hypothetical protein
MSRYYFTYPAVSNSMLSEFERKMFGGFKPNLTNAYEFGHLVHQLILEPHLEVLAPKSLTTLQVDTIHDIVEKSGKHKFLNWTRQFSQKEVEIYWHDDVTGLPLKSKLDTCYKKGQIVCDLKTTSAKSEKAFRSTFKKFGYFRQAAYYLDSVQGKRFVFIAIQKFAPFNIYQVELTPEELDIGRNQYRKLLNKAHQMNYFTNFLKPV